jgi:acyl dehydratase
MPHISELPQRVFAPIEQTYTERGTILYALGLGLGQNPIDTTQLRYVYEDGLQTLPTQAAVLASPGFWMQEPDTGIDWRQLVAGGHMINLHAPLPTSGTVISSTKVTDVFDRGRDKGALIHWERDLVDKSTGQLIAHIRCSAFARGDGGFGGSHSPPRNVKITPTRPADHQFDWQTTPGQALLYRLSGDMNPLHASPEVAKSAGFDRPILHGLCTLGIAGFQLVANCAGADGFRSVGAQYTGVVYPGDLLQTEVWEDGETLSFRTRAVNRERIVLDGGVAVQRT